jgi:repressor LexA
MQDAGILDGDLLVVHKTDDAQLQIVVARLAVKRLKRAGVESLLAENAAFAPIVVDPKQTSFAIEGVAVGLIRPSRSL